MKVSKYFLFVLFFLNAFVFVSNAQDTAIVTKEKKFTPSGKVFAAMFFEYYNVLQGDDIYTGKSQFTKNNAGDNSFSFRRVYLGYTHSFSEKFSGKVEFEITDFTILEGGQRAPFLKEANLTWKNIYPLADLSVGHCLTPVWSLNGAEWFWQYRSIEKTMADARGLRSSNDSGIRLRGSFNKSRTYGYNFMVGNGNSARAENDKYKIVYFNLWTKLLDKRLYLEIFQDYNKAADNKYITTTKALIAWKTPKYTIATEGVNQMRSKFGADNGNYIIQGISVFAHFNIMDEKLRAFGRYDSFNPDAEFAFSHYDGDDIIPFDENFYVLGFDYRPLKNIHIMPNIWINSYNNKTVGQTTPKSEIVARLTFNVSFK